MNWQKGGLDDANKISNNYQEQGVLDVCSFEKDNTCDLYASFLNTKFSYKWSKKGNILQLKYETLKKGVVEYEVRKIGLNKMQFISPSKEKEKKKEVFFLIGLLSQLRRYPKMIIN